MNSTTIPPTSYPDHPIFHAHPFYYSNERSLIPIFPDPLLTVLAPIPAYWLTSGLFHLFDVSNWTWLERYRIHDSAEVASRNRATRRQVLGAVLFQQVVQTVLGLLWISEESERADHVAAMRGIARVLSSPSFLFGAPAALVGDASPGLAYLLHWWFIPAAQLLLAMYVVPPSLISPFFFHPVLY